MLHGVRGMLALLQGSSQFYVFSLAPEGQHWTVVALVRFHCLCMGQAADSTGCLLSAGNYSRTYCQLVYWDSEAKVHCWLPH